MCDDFMIKAGVSVECQDCGKRTTVPALRVVPGVKCEHCGTVLSLGVAEVAAKQVMLDAAAVRRDVKVD